jgi:hypothetical protein
MAQFPVSSGKQHSIVENTWIPVTTSSTNTATTTTTVATITTAKPKVTLTSQIQEQLPELAKPKPKPPTVPPPPEKDPTPSRPYDWKSDDHYCRNIVPTLDAPPEVKVLIKKKTNIYLKFNFHSQPPCDVSEIISQRLNAMRKLQDDPNDVEAHAVLLETQQNVKQKRFSWKRVYMY